MKSILLIAALSICSSSIMAHRLDENKLVFDKPPVTEAPATGDQVDPVVVDQKKEAEKASLKMIDDLTEKVYLQRRKAWHKEAVQQAPLSIN